MARPAWVAHVAAVLGYVVVAVVFSWPLLPNVTTHLTGDPGGDTGVYVWNQWVFQHGALVEGRNPLTTEHIFSLTTRPVDLSQHNYTLFLNLLAMPLMGWLGTVATFNVVYLLAVVLTAWMTFIHARRITGGATAEAWLAGLAFAWAPLMVARSTGHFSLVMAAPLPAFLWCLHRLDRSERLCDSVLAGAVVAWAAFCDAYYGVYCLMIGTLYVTSRVLRFEWRPEWRQGPGRWILDLCILLAGGMVAGLMLGRGGRVELLGVPVSVRGLYTPMFLLTVLVLARVLDHAASAHRCASPCPTRGRSARWSPPASPARWCCRRPSTGRRSGCSTARWVSPPIYWRSSPAGVDLLAFLQPNPSHPLVTWLAGSAQLAAPTVFVEHTASLSLVVLAVVVFGAWRLGLRPAGWVTLTVVFGLLALGPFVHVAGVNTYVPGPWALLRYVPVFGLARSPTRFAIVAALGLTMLFALALAECGRRWPHRRRQVLAVTARGAARRAVAGAAAALLGGDFSRLRRGARRPARRADSRTAIRRPRRHLVGRRFQRPVSVQPDAARQAADGRLPVAGLGAAGARGQGDADAVGIAGAERGPDAAGGGSRGAAARRPGVRRHGPPRLGGRAPVADTRGRSTTSSCRRWRSNSSPRTKTSCSTGPASARSVRLPPPLHRRRL